MSVTEQHDATASYLAGRQRIAATGSYDASRRTTLSGITDDWVTALFARSGLADSGGVALVAIGGYGRRELSPGSDLDLLLLHAPNVALGDAPEQLWYPIWDSGIRLDHSVRAPAEVRRLAANDLTVMLGMLDARTIAGDERLTAAAQSSVLADWRALAEDRLDELRALVNARRERSGDLAHLLEPDLKESYGGIRDSVVLRAIAASWITDIPREPRLLEARVHLLNVRDALHDSTGRATDRLVQEEQGPVADAMQVADADALLRSVSAAARVVAVASDATWYRVDRVLRRRPAAKRSLLRRGIRLRDNKEDDTRTPLAEGVVAHDGSVVLSTEAKPDRDPVLVLRAAAAAAQRGLPLAPHTVDRLASECPPLPVPWPAEARDSLVSLLGAGPAAIAVWEALDQAELPSRWIPGWDVVRSAPQRNPVHRFTVDRHLVETATAAAEFTRSVSRPDLLLIGCLLHDIGKARPGVDHTDEGVRLVTDLAPMMGFDAADSKVLVALVRHHLLLPDAATGRDLGDPATAAAVAKAVGDHATLDLLHALTRADAAATGPAAWSDWKAALVQELVDRTHAELRGDPPPEPPRLTAAQLALAQARGISVEVDNHAGDGVTITVATDDRVGLLAAIAGVLALHRLEVRAAETLTVDEARRAVTVWKVRPSFGDPPAAERIREDLRLALEGSLDLDGRLARRESDYAVPGRALPDPRVTVVESASERATVLEVRAHDSPGLLHRVSTALAGQAVDVVAARVATLGSDVVDVFYLVDREGAPLSPQTAQAVRHEVLAVLTGPRER